MKTPEELNALKAEAEALNGKLTELNEDELDDVVGGRDQEIRADDDKMPREKPLY